MNILNLKQIPIKVFCNNRRHREVVIALHWKWSITWRWLIRYQLVHTSWRINSFKNESNGYSWSHICMGRLGQINIDIQPNMKR